MSDRNSVRSESLRDIAMRRHRELHYPDPETRASVLTTGNAHKCAAYGCPSRIAADRLFCSLDWELVPGALRKALSEAYDPRADLRWPIHLVEQAIRVTIRTDDMQAILNRVELSLQEDLFEAAKCQAEHCASHLHCDGCLGRKKEYLQLCMERLGLRQVAGVLCTVTLQRNAVAATRANAPQSDLFANQSRSANDAGSHVRIR